jgi:hypothetical protein
MTTTPADHAAPELDLGDPDRPLPTFALLARISATGAADPVRDVQRQLTEAGLHAEEVRSLDSTVVGHPEVLARFVLSSLDGETALRALHEHLRAAGLPVDELWLDRQL